MFRKSPQPQNPQNTVVDTHMIQMLRDDIQKIHNRLDELNLHNEKAVTVQAQEPHPEGKKKTVEQANGIGLPDQPITNFVWLCFATILVGSFACIAFSFVFSITFLQKTPADAGLQTIYTIFTLIVGIFTGRLLPGPKYRA